MASKSRSTPGSRNASLSHPDIPYTRSGIRRTGTISSALAVSALMEISSPPVSTTKYAGWVELSIPRTMGSRFTRIGSTKSASVCGRSEEHTSELQSLAYLVCRLLLEKKKENKQRQQY